MLKEYLLLLRRILGAQIGMKGHMPVTNSYNATIKANNYKNPDIPQRRSARQKKF